MAIQSINVIQKHTLGVAVAKARLIALAQEEQKKQEKNKRVTLKEIAWTEINNTATFTIDVMGVTVRGMVVITPDYVEISTENLPPIAWAFDYFIETTIQAKLSEALK